jgi:hypothetical protein
MAGNFVTPSQRQGPARTASLVRIATLQFASSLRGTMVARWQRLRMQLFATYRPEKHYMRGRDPKCRKNG